MNKLILSFIVLLSISEGFSQNYYELAIEGEMLYNSKSFKLSSEKYDSAFYIQEGFSRDYYNAACSHALTDNKISAIKYLRKSIEKGNSDIDWMKNDPDLQNLYNTDLWKDFMEEIPTIQAQSQSKLNTVLKSRLEELRMQDQVIRLLLPDAEKRFGRKSKEYDWFRNTLMPRNDSIILKEIEMTISLHGWVGISEVGELANQTLWLVIQHAPLETQLRFMPLLKKSVKKGESKAEYLAFLHDRILMKQGKKQIYGTQSLWDKKLNKNVIYSIENPEGINQRRASMGLLPLDK